MKLQEGGSGASNRSAEALEREMGDIYFEDESLSVGERERTDIICRVLFLSLPLHIPPGLSDAGAKISTWLSTNQQNKTTPAPSNL